jgi:hypothetical protein
MTDTAAATITLRQIRASSRVFTLNAPLEIASFRQDDLWYYESKPLSMLSFGHSQDEALNSFHEDFAVLWDAIAQSPDEALTNGAVAVKRELHRIVRSVSAA